MKRLALSAMLGFAMVAAAAAQTGTGSTTTPTPDQSSGSNTAAGASATGTQDQTASASTKTDKKMDSKVKMTGCIQKEGNGYALVDKKHPNGVQLLSSEDLSAHVGHKVQVKGTWEAASMSSASSSTPSGSASASSTSPSSSSSASNAPMSEKVPSASSSSSASGTGTSANPSALPQSDQAAGGQAIRVTEVKMKSDKCEMTSGNNNPSKY